MKVLFLVSLISMSLGAMHEVVTVSKEVHGKDVTYFGYDASNRLIVGAAFLSGNDHNQNTYFFWGDKAKFGRSSFIVFQALKEKYSDLPAK